MAVVDTNEELTQAAVSGDREALGKLLLRNDAALRLQIAAKIPAFLRSQLDEQDVLQVTYLEAYLSIHSFAADGPSSFATWLRRIAANNLTDAIRHLTAAKQPPATSNITSAAVTDQSYWLLLHELTSGGKTPSSIVSREESRVVLENCLPLLPPDYETVIRLGCLGKLSKEEIAQHMGRSIGNVYLLQQQSKKRLRHLLDTSSRCPRA